MNIFGKSVHISGKLVHIFGKLVHIFARELVSRTSKQVSRNLGPLWQPGVHNYTRFFSRQTLFSLLEKPVFLQLALGFKNQDPDLPFLALLGKARKTTQKARFFFSILNL